MENQGFDPVQQVQEKDKEDEGIADFDKLDYPGYLDVPQDAMMQLVIDFK